MPEKYAYRVRILFFVKRKKNACGNTHAYIRMFGKAAFTERPYLRICVKKYGYAYKNTHIRIKFLLSLVYFILPFTEHAYLRMRISACVFLRLAKNKIRTRYAYFSGFYNKIILRYAVIRLLSVVIMILVFETLNLNSVLTKAKLLFLHKCKRFFFSHF